LVEKRRESLVFIEAELGEGLPLLHSITDKLSNYGMGLAEGNALLHQIVASLVRSP